MDLNENWYIFAHRIILQVKILLLLDILLHHTYYVL